MAAATEPPLGPDLSEGIALTDVRAPGMLAGRVGDEPVLLFRSGDEWSAVGGACTHYGAPLAEGIVVGETIRCPWHHACFSLRTGAAIKAPAFDPLPRWMVEIEGERLFVRSKLEPDAEARAESPSDVQRIVIIGGGAAGFAAAERLRGLGYQGVLTMLSEDESPPCDRPNLSKDYLAGHAPAEWIPLKGEDYYRDNDIDLRLGARVTAIDVAGRQVATADGEKFGFDRLLLATGAEPIRLPAPGFSAPNVFTLRSLADARAIIAAAKGATRAAVIGASFIGLEAAAALRAHGLEVHVVAPETVPMAKVLGPEIGSFVRRLHEAQGVLFHLDRTAEGFDGSGLTLDDGSALDVDLVVLGIGVKPRIALASAAGLAVDGGVLVDEYLQSSIKGIYAAGDIAFYPRPGSDARVRVEHWVAAERQGQAAAANMLGLDAQFRDVPFFWSRHYDVSILYVGETRSWDESRIEGSVSDRDCTVRFYENGMMRASASIGRPVQNLREELRLEQG
jgi:NADPH-dependent 2,4-dienoyl-CoA reductase/sulfur reductase-like enzyme/nitrite reductase/ring-hydroxylating ferredoxin subunit